MVSQENNGKEWNYRGKIDIRAEILNKAKNGIKKTNLMYKAKLSFRQLKIYLDYLINKGLLTINNGIFKTTQGGIVWLDGYQKLNSLLPWEKYSVDKLYAELNGNGRNSVLPPYLKNS